MAAQLTPSEISELANEIRESLLQYIVDTYGIQPIQDFEEASYDIIFHKIHENYG